MDQTRRDAISALRCVGAVGVVALGIMAASPFVSLPCPLLHFTGMQCPLCGSTRAGMALLRGDLGAAWGYNAMSCIALVIVAICVVGWTIQALGGPVWRPFGGRMTQRRAYLLVGVAAVVFMVVRNLV